VAQPRRDPFSIALFAFARVALGDESVVVDRYVAEVTEAAESTPLRADVVRRRRRARLESAAHLELDDESDAALEDELATSSPTAGNGDYD